MMAIRKVLPLLFPTVLAAEIALVWSGVLTVQQAVITGAILEAALASFAVMEVLLVIRGVRAGRAAGRGGWLAAEDGLARIMPRPLAKVILLEPRLAVSLVRWIARRPDRAGGEAFGYPINAMILWVIVGLTFVELGMVEFLLIVFKVPFGWTVFSIILHIYTVLWLVAMMGSFYSRPHVLTADGILVRDGVLHELRFRYDALSDATVRLRRADGMGGRSGLKVKDSVAILAYDDATVLLTFRPDAVIHHNGQPVATPYQGLWISVRDAVGFVDRVRSRLSTLV